MNQYMKYSFRGVQQGRAVIGQGDGDIEQSLSVSELRCLIAKESIVPSSALAILKSAMEHLLNSNTRVA